MDAKQYGDRHSVRLRGYDYALNGAYYVTICAFQKQKLFGEFRESIFQISEFGLIVQNEWHRTAELRKYVFLDEYIIMPNHIHGILVIDNPNQDQLPRHYEKERKNYAASLGGIMINFKAAVTKQCRLIVNNTNQEIWQRSYYDHIIRNEDDLNRCREYIIQNPSNWNNDELFLP